MILNNYIIVKNQWRLFDLKVLFSPSSAVHSRQNFSKTYSVVHFLLSLLLNNQGQFSHAIIEKFISTKTIFKIIKKTQQTNEELQKLQNPPTPLNPLTSSLSQDKTTHPSPKRLLFQRWYAKILLNFLQIFRFFFKPLIYFNCWSNSS